MEPVIPDGAACLFRRVDAPSSPERAVLVRHGGTADPETGGALTVKRYRAADGRVVLEPVNAEFAPILGERRRRSAGDRGAGESTWLSDPAKCLRYVSIQASTLWCQRLPPSPLSHTPGRVGASRQVTLTGHDRVEIPCFSLSELTRNEDL